MLKATATFMFDRYSAGKFSSYDRYRGSFNNRNEINANVDKPISMVNSITDTDGIEPYNWRTSEDTATSFPVVDGEIYYGDA